MYSSENKIWDHWDRFVKYGYEVENDCNIKILDAYTSGINSVTFEFLKGTKKLKSTVMIDEQNIPSESDFKDFFKSCTK